MLGEMLPAAVGLSCLVLSQTAKRVKNPRSRASCKPELSFLPGHNGEGASAQRFWMATQGRWLFLGAKGQSNPFLSDQRDYQENRRFLLGSPRCGPPLPKCVSIPFGWQRPRGGTQTGYRPPLGHQLDLGPAKGLADGPGAA